MSPSLSLNAQSPRRRLLLRTKDEGLDVDPDDVKEEELDELELDDDDEEDADETELDSPSEESTSPVSKLTARTFSDKRGQSDRSKTYPRVVQAQRKPMITVAVSPFRSRKRAYTEMAARGIVTTQEDKKKMKVATRYRP